MFVEQSRLSLGLLIFLKYVYVIEVNYGDWIDDGELASLHNSSSDNLTIPSLPFPQTVGGGGGGGGAESV